MVRVVIESADLEEIRQADGSSQDRIVLTLTGKKKRLILNKTQGVALAGIAGSETDHWPGFEINLIAQPTPQGKKTIAILPTEMETESADAGPF